jgi:signal transduction histidine kinase
VFEPYFTPRPRETPSGMGLFVIRQILGTVQGSVRVRSAGPEGTSLEIRLPLDPTHGHA